MAIDPTWLSAITTSLGMARQIASTAKEIRDFNQFAAVVSQINDQLLKAQDGLLQLQAGMFSLQQEHFETAKELAELKETLSERRRYALFQIGKGVCVYRADFRPESSGAGDPIPAEPSHYICQPCFDGISKIKAVLHLRERSDGFRGWVCPVCKTTAIEREATFPVLPVESRERY